MPKFGDRTIRRWENEETAPSLLELQRILDFPETIPFPNPKTVPQNQERIYIIGFNKEKVKNFRRFTFPLPLEKKVKVGDILENEVNEKYTISDALWTRHQRRKEEHIQKGNGFGYSLFNEASPYTNPLSARYYKDGSEILIEQKGKNPRKLTPREAARLQGFPEEYLIPVSDTQAYKQFGNSVAVPVIYALARQIIDVLDHSESDALNNLYLAPESPTYTELTLF